MRLMKFTCIFIAVLSSYITSAQNYKVKYSDKYKLEKRTLIEEIFSENENGYYTLKITYTHKGNYPTLEEYDVRLARTKSQKLDLDGLEFKRYVFVGSKLYFILSDHNIKTGEEKFYAQSVNISTFKLNEDKKLLFELNSIKQSYGEDARRFNVLKVSEDKSKVMYCFEYYDGYNPSEKQSFYTYVFDANFNSLWGKKMSLPLPIVDLKFKDVYIDNEGTVHLLSGYKPEETGSVLMDVIYTINDKKVNKYSVHLKGKKIWQTELYVGNTGSYLVAGVYSEDNETGFFSANLDKAKNEITDTVFKMVNNPKLKKYKCLFSDIQQVNDTSYYMTGELFFRRVVPYSAETDQTYRLEYKKEDLMLLYFNKNNQIDFVRAIPKTQSTNFNWKIKFFGYAAYVDKNSTVLVYNDNVENIECRNKQCIKEYDGPGEPTDLVLVDINKAQRIQKIAVLPKYKDSFTIMPNLLYHTGDSFIMWGMDGNGYRLVRVSK